MLLPSSDFKDKGCERLFDTLFGGCTSPPWLIEACSQNSLLSLSGLHEALKKHKSRVTIFTL